MVVVVSMSKREFDRLDVAAFDPSLSQRAKMIASTRNDVVFLTQII